MSDTTNTADSGAGAPAPAQSPPNDAHASQHIEKQGQEAAPPTDADAEQAKQEKQRNRTKAYIDRLNRENAELRAWKAQQENRQQQPPSNAPAQRQGAPRLEDFDFDHNAYQQARDQWVIDQAKTSLTEETRKAEEARKQQDTMVAYYQRANEFAADHPDFEEVVGSIAYPLHDALQAAIAAHPNGPQIAYHLGNNDDEAFALASIQPHLAAAAVQRLAARLSAAPAAPAVPALNTKPITQAPAPPPTVGGRAVADVPDDKLTDEEWFRRERERERSGRR